MIRTRFAALALAGAMLPTAVTPGRQAAAEGDSVVAAAPAPAAPELTSIPAHPDEPAAGSGADPLATPSRAHRLAAIVSMGGLYGGFATWSYFAWYRTHAELAKFRSGGDGWFGATTYAGGADKLGHAWATMALARGGTALLRWGGFAPVPASIVGSALAFALFFSVEVKDGFYYEFSYGDLTFDALGAVLAAALDNVPALDRYVDFRVQYYPSDLYLDQLDGGNVNAAEDYSGETYLAALHLGAVPRLGHGRYTSWTRFVDVAVGYETRNYKPEPSEGVEVERRQHLFLGVSLNAQGVVDWLLAGPAKRSGAARVSRAMGHGLFELFNVPYTTLPVAGVARSPDD